MEITMNDIIAFINNAMSSNLLLEGHNEGFFYPSVIIEKNNKRITFMLKYKENVGSYLVISSNIYTGNNVAIKNLSETEIATFKLMCARVKEHSQNKLRSYFWDFFKEDEKPPTINDLDNEDD